MEKVSSLVLLLLLSIQCLHATVTTRNATTGNETGMIDPSIREYSGTQGLSLMIPRIPVIHFPNQLLVHFEWKTVNDLDDTYPDILPRNRRIIQDAYGNLYFTSLELDDDLYGRLYKVFVYDRLTNTILEEGSYSRLTVIRGSLVRSAPKLLLPVAGVDRGIMGVEEQAVTLQCIFGGIPEITVKWEGPTIKGRLRESGTMLYIQKLSKQDKGDYICTGENWYGEKKETIPLTVKSKVHLTEEPSHQVLTPDTKFVVFTCEAAAEVPLDLNWNWISYGGQPLSDKRIKIKDNYLKINLEDVPFDVVKTYAGKYACNASDGYSWALGTAKLEIWQTGGKTSLIIGLVIGGVAVLVIGLVVFAVANRKKLPELKERSPFGSKSTLA